jgi:hypothetical protein
MASVTALSSLNQDDTRASHGQRTWWIRELARREFRIKLSPVFGKVLLEAASHRRNPLRLTAANVRIWMTILRGRINYVLFSDTPRAAQRLAIQGLHQMAGEGTFALLFDATDSEADNQRHCSDIAVALSRELQHQCYQSAVGVTRIKRSFRRFKARKRMALAVQLGRREFPYDLADVIASFCFVPEPTLAQLHGARGAYDNQRIR